MKPSSSYSLFTIHYSLAEGVSPEKVAVGDVMVTNLVTANREEDVFTIIKKMRKHGIRRLPVVDDWHNLIGIITLDDLLEFIADEIQGISAITSKEIRKEAVSRP